MDENYLDSLLNQVSSDKKQNNSLEHAMDMDAGIDIDLSDLNDISLGELDGLDDIDLSELDLDDIDFDDIDVTDIRAEQKNKAPEQVEDDFNLDALLEASEESEKADLTRERSTEALERTGESSASETDMQVNPDDVFAAAYHEMEEDISFPEAMLESGMSDAEAPRAEADDAEPESTEASDTSEAFLMNDSADLDSMDLDDLFSALGIDENAETDDESVESAYTAGEAELDDLLKLSMEMSAERGDLDDIEDISEVKSQKGKKKKQKKNDGIKEKKTLSEIIFGVPDEEDLEEERLLEEKRAEKKIKKEKQKEEKQGEKNAALELKKKADEKKKKDRENRKKEKEAELKAELEAENAGKKLSTPAVAGVFLAFAALAFFVIFGTKQFNYTQVIHKAADYFERQRYHLAYEEVSGVDVKKKDEELRDRIYTVMYVERLYESYENNMALNRPDKALDALLRGLEKYDEHYEEAVELDIVEDIDLCRSKILDALSTTYGLTETQAYNIMALEGQKYMQMLTQYSENLQTGE